MESFPDAFEGFFFRLKCDFCVSQRVLNMFFFSGAGVRVGGFYCCFYVKTFALS